MSERKSLPELEAAILKKRRQRIRRVTYDRVAAAMLEDATSTQPFRHRLVLDWWNRVVDPLEAEKFDAERLRYFRSRLREHRTATTRNAAIRQGHETGNQLRRLKPDRLTYIEHQVRRLGDRQLNYAAAARAVETNNHVYEALTLGLISLPALRPAREGWLYRIVTAATTDRRFEPLVSRLRANAASMLPEKSMAEIEFHLTLLTDPSVMYWPEINDALSFAKHLGLIRKLEAEYLNDL